MALKLSQQLGWQNRERKSTVTNNIWMVNTSFATLRFLDEEAPDVRARNFSLSFFKPKFSLDFFFFLLVL